MIIQVESDACNVIFPVPGIHNNAQSRVRIVDVHIPDPPLLPPFTDGVATNVEDFSIRETRSMPDLIDALDALAEGGNRLVNTYWNGTEFEIVPIYKTLTLSAAFAAVLKLPTTLALNQFYSSCISVDAIDVSAGTCVELFLGEMEGFWDGEYTSDAARLKRGQSEPPVVWFYTRAPANSGSIRVYSIERATGARRLLELRDGERWSARIELELPAHAFTHEGSF